jgi:anthranilate phosphoribosyltransferase
MTITAQEALQRTIEHREIFPDEMLSIMRRIMSGEVTPVMIAALTVGLRVKKETIGEISAAAQVMREFATKVDVPDREHLLDIVGTGGDSSHTFNISTASMFVAAAAGARVAKHGGRSVSSKSGSAGRARGARREHHAEARPGRAVDRRNRHRLHVRAVAPQRDEARRPGAQGARRADHLQHPGTADQSRGSRQSAAWGLPPDLVGIQVRVLQRLGSRPRGRRLRQGRDGRVSLGAATMVGELKDGEVREYEIHPEISDCDDLEPWPQGHRRGGIEEMVLEALGNARARRARSSC